jgi:ArsR family transcriptional regulator
MVDTKHIDINFTNTELKAAGADLQVLVELLKAVGDEHRLEILRMLSRREMCACEIHGPLGIPQNLASHHLKTLREVGLVTTRRDGRMIIYSINRKKLKTISRMLDRMTGGSE